ncbi:hypothetical protein FDECE_16155 [Fusarium decemcellulare]|nr:hypothetical protein FDECE_16155 [Fusarium decemcellulare]
MIDTLGPDPKDPFLIIDPANTIGDLAMELLELCSYIGRWSDLDVPACGKQGARYHLAKAQDGLWKLEHKSYRWINEIVHRLEILATQIHSEADDDQKTIDIEQLAAWVLVHLDETAPRYDKLFQIVQNTTRHLRESDHL